jgi:hypothetical protein
VIPFNCFQSSKTADREPLSVTLTPINEPVNVLGNYFSSLQKHRIVARLQLLIHLKCSLNGSWRNNFLNLFHNSALTKGLIVRWKRRADAKVPSVPSSFMRRLEPLANHVLARDHLGS